MKLKIHFEYTLKYIKGYDLRQISRLELSQDAVPTRTFQVYRFSLRTDFGFVPKKGSKLVTLV